MNATGMGLAMLIIWIVVILIAVFIVWTLISRAGSGSGSVSAQESALDILKKRYAHGEISEEEFEHKRKKLE